MHAIASTSRTVLLVAGTASLFLGVARAQIDDSIRGAPERGQPLHRDARRLGAPDDALGRARHPRHVGHDAGLARPARALRRQLLGKALADVPVRRSHQEPAAERALALATCRKPGSRKRSTTSAWRSGATRSTQAGKRWQRAISAARCERARIDPNIPQRQTSLIVDPPNGLLPALTPEGKRRALEMRSGWTLPGENHTYDGPQDFDSWDRCITRGMPSSMMPYRYNGGFRIIQAPGYVVFQLEMIHEARVIPTDGRDAARGGDRTVPRRVARTLGRDDARRRDDRVQGRPAADQPRRRRLAAGQSFPLQQRDENDGANRSSERRVVALRDHDRRSRRPHAAVHGALPAAQRPRVLHARVRMPREQHDRSELCPDEPSRA